jgi:DNA-binding transcriptional ArsR family regulator
MSDEGEYNSPEAFVEGVPLTKVFGLHPKTQILAAMLSERDDELAAFTTREVSRITGLDERELSKHLDEFLEYGLVTETTDDMPETETYKLCHEHQAVDTLIELNETLAGHFQE